MLQPPSYGWWEASVGSVGPFLGGTFLLVPVRWSWTSVDINMMMVVVRTRMRMRMMMMMVVMMMMMMMMMLMLIMMMLLVIMMMTAMASQPVTNRNEIAYNIGIWVAIRSWYWKIVVATSIEDIVNAIPAVQIGMGSKVGVNAWLMSNSGSKPSFEQPWSLASSPRFHVYIQHLLYTVYNIYIYILYIYIYHAKFVLICPP